MGEFMTRALRNDIDLVATRIENGLTLIASARSVAPYIGFLAPFVGFTMH